MALRRSGESALAALARSSTHSPLILATSSGQASLMATQNSRLSGEAARSVTRASNNARRWFSNSAARCCASTPSRRASRMSASTALRSRSRLARWRVTMGSSGAPAAGGLPNSPSRAFRSLNWPVRAAANFSLSRLMASTWASTSLTSSPVSLGLGSLSNCARNWASVGLGSGAASWASAPVAARAISRQAMRWVIQRMGPS